MLKCAYTLGFCLIVSVAAMAGTVKIFLICDFCVWRFIDEYVSASVVHLWNKNCCHLKICIMY